MSAHHVAAIGALVDAHRELIPVLEDHLEDNDGEVLPHLVMADVIRWLVVHRTDAEVCRRILDWMEAAYTRGPDDVRGLIVVSGVEMIPDPGQPGAELRELLGHELREHDPWLR